MILPQKAKYNTSIPFWYTNFETHAVIHFYISCTVVGKNIDITPLRQKCLSRYQNINYNRKFNLSLI